MTTRYLRARPSSKTAMGETAERAFRRHYAQVFRYVRRRSQTHGQAEDVTQDVFVDAARALDRSVASAPLLAWLYTVAQRRLTDEARRRGRAPLPAPAAALQSVPTPVSEYGPEVARAIAEAVTHLPDGQRRVVVLKLLEGRGFAEIAVTVGATEAACKMRFVRGLESLREQLERKGIAP
jgi:RNA polymerase sigma factor (sigma-70 family)